MRDRTTRCMPMKLMQQSPGNYQQNFSGTPNTTRHKKFTKCDEVANLYEPYHPKQILDIAVKSAYCSGAIRRQCTAMYR